MPRAPECLDWRLTARQGDDVPALQEEQLRLQRIEDATRELREATGRWFYEYGRVMKAMYGYEWEHGEPAQNTDALFAAEAAYYAALAHVAATSAAPQPAAAEPEYGGRFSVTPEGHAALAAHPRHLEG